MLPSNLQTGTAEQFPEFLSAVGSGVAAEQPQPEGRDKIREEETASRAQHPGDLTHTLQLIRPVVKGNGADDNIGRRICKRK
jgi:hypothetical protein